MPPRYNATIGHPGISILLFLLTQHPAIEPKRQSPARFRRNLDFIGARAASNTKGAPEVVGAGPMTQARKYRGQHPFLGEDLNMGPKPSASQGYF
jgi:hypothetical protein